MTNHPPRHASDSEGTEPGALEIIEDCIRILENEPDHRIAVKRVRHSLKCSAELLKRAIETIARAEGRP